MYIVFEINNSDKIIAREFPLATEGAVEKFTEETKIPIKKEWLKEEKFADHLFTQLQANSDENITYMVGEVSLH